jgi:hypothetical protein
MKYFICLLIGLMFLPGCAANMAFNGQNGPDLELVKQEIKRDDVERRLGYPARTEHWPDGSQTSLYEVEAKTEPDTARAVGHGMMDLWTLGLWEFVGGPIEAYKGQRQLVTVDYNGEGEVMAVSVEDKGLF